MRQILQKFKEKFLLRISFNSSIYLKQLVCLLPFFMIYLGLCAQKDYNAYYKAMNPATDNMSVEQKHLVLQSFLDSAILMKDTVKIIHSYLYLANLTFLSGDFSVTMDRLILAEQLAKKQKNNLLLGRISHKKAALQTSLQNYEKAIDYFDVAKTYHLIAKDSQYLGLTYEQLGAVYSYIDSFEISAHYYQLALPVIEQYASEKSLAVFYANYGHLFSAQDSTEAAIRNFQKALQINLKIGNIYQSVPCRQNIAWEYAHLHQYDKALALYYECLQLNKVNKWDEFLIYTYAGLVEIYTVKEQFDSAFYYEQAYHHLKDSVVGSEVQTDILEMETRALRQDQDHQIRENEAALVAQKKRTVGIIFLGAILLLSSGLGWYFRYWKHRGVVEKLAQTKNALAETQATLSERFEESDPQKVASQENAKTRMSTNVPVVDSYPSQILTIDDWYTFKTLFEKNHPAYLHRLRTAHPEMSEAEERLFLLLKLNLTTQEIAYMLNIQLGSVKKARIRLRKRLNLQSEDSLSGYINSF